MANDLDNAMTVLKDEIRQHQERMITFSEELPMTVVIHKAKDTHVRCTEDHGKPENTEFEDAVARIIVQSFWKYPKSWGWMVAALLLGLSTGWILAWLGAGLGSLIVGHLLLHAIRNG